MDAVKQQHFITVQHASGQTFISLYPELAPCIATTTTKVRINKNNKGLPSTHQHGVNDKCPLNCHLGVVVPLYLNVVTNTDTYTNTNSDDNAECNYNIKRVNMATNRMTQTLSETCLSNCNGLPLNMTPNTRSISRPDRCPLNEATTQYASTYLPSSYHGYVARQLRKIAVDILASSKPTNTVSHMFIPLGFSDMSSFTMNTMNTFSEQDYTRSVLKEMMQAYYVLKNDQNNDTNANNRETETIINNIINNSNGNIEHCVITNRTLPNHAAHCFRPTTSCSNIVSEKISVNMVTFDKWKTLKHPSQSVSPSLTNTNKTKSKVANQKPPVRTSIDYHGFKVSSFTFEQHFKPIVTLFEDKQSSYRFNESVCKNISHLFNSTNKPKESSSNITPMLGNESYPLIIGCANYSIDNISMRKRILCSFVELQAQLRFVVDRISNELKTENISFENYSTIPFLTLYPSHTQGVTQ